MVDHRTRHLIVALIVAAIGLSACASSSSNPQPLDSNVPITSIDAIKGKWAGIVERSKSHRDDWLELTIEDDATVRAFSARTIGAFQGTTKVMIADGQGVSESDRFRTTYRLLDRGGKPVLRIEAVEKTSGLRSTADLTR